MVHWYCICMGVFDAVKVLGPVGFKYKWALSIYNEKH